MSFGYSGSPSFFGNVPKNNAEDEANKAADRQLEMKKFNASQSGFNFNPALLQKNTFTPSSGVATLQDMVDAAQRLGEQKVKSYGNTLNQNVDEIAKGLVQRLRGQNAGSSGTGSGIGDAVTGKVLGDQAQRLENYAVGEGANLGKYALDKQYETRQRIFDLVKSGQITGQQAADSLASMGINPGDFSADPLFEAEKYAASKGLTLDQLKTNLGTTGSYLAQDVQDNPERYAGVAVDPVAEQKRQEKLAEAAAPKSGGKVLCTELHRQGKLSSRIYALDLQYSETIREDVKEGYRFLAKPFVIWMARSPRVTAILEPLILAWAYQMAYKMGGSFRRNYLGMALEFVGVPVCFMVGKCLSKKQGVEVR